MQKSKNHKKTFSDCTKWQVMKTEMNMDLLSEAKKKKGSKTGELSSLTRELATQISMRRENTI